MAAFGCGHSMINSRHGAAQVSATVAYLVYVAFSCLEQNKISHYHTCALLAGRKEDEMKNILSATPGCRSLVLS